MQGEAFSSHESIWFLKVLRNYALALESFKTFDLIFDPSKVTLCSYKLYLIAQLCASNTELLNAHANHLDPRLLKYKLSK